MPDTGEWHITVCLGPEKFDSPGEPALVQKHLNGSHGEGPQPTRHFRTCEYNQPIVSAFDRGIGVENRLIDEKRYHLRVDTQLAFNTIANPWAVGNILQSELIAAQSKEMLVTDRVE